MKKITKGWSKNYHSLKIFRDDIDEIAGIITSEFKKKEGSEGLDIKLEFGTDEFVLDNLIELGELKDDYLQFLETEE